MLNNEKLQTILKEWSYDQNSLVRDFKFTDFNQAFAFMTRIAMLSEKVNHHPEWFNSYNMVSIKLKTSEVNDITEKDLSMALIINDYFENRK